MYHLFAGDDYYPMGGLGDYRGSFPTIEDAHAATLSIRYLDWWEIAAIDFDGNLSSVDKGRRS